MKSRIVIEFKGDHIHVRQYGEDNYDISLRLWRDIVAACEKHGCYNILGETYASDLSATDAYKHVEIFKKARVRLKHRIAWVNHSKDSENVIKLIENATKNRMITNGNLFDDVAEAKKWLLGYT